MEGLEYVGRLEPVTSYAGVYKLTHDGFDGEEHVCYCVSIETDDGYFQETGFETLYAAVYVANVVMCTEGAYADKLNSLAVPGGTNVRIAMREIHRWRSIDKNRLLEVAAKRTCEWATSLWRSLLDADEKAGVLRAQVADLLRSRDYFIQKYADVLGGSYYDALDDVDNLQEVLVGVQADHEKTVASLEAKLAGAILEANLYRGYWAGVSPFERKRVVQEGVERASKMMRGGSK